MKAAWGNQRRVDVGSEGGAHAVLGRAVGCPRSASIRCRWARGKSCGCGRMGLRGTSLTAQAAADLEMQTGFVQEMKSVAMQLHTKDQAQQGEKPRSETPFTVWKYTREGFLKYLVESKEVFDALENLISSNSAYAAFRDTGFERTPGLLEDIAWMESTYGLKAPEPQAEGSGIVYARYLTEIAEPNPPAFLCHYYNINFAHTAGGRMIGKKVATDILDGQFSQLAFYKYRGNLSEITTSVKAILNKVTESWSQEEKDRCLNETKTSFKYSGDVLRTLFDI